MSSVVLSPPPVGVPPTRTITTTSPVTIDGGASANLSADRTVAVSNIPNSSLANMAANSIKGNNTGSPAAAADLTAAETRTVLGLATIATSGSASDLSTGTLPAGRF